MTNEKVSMAEMIEYLAGIPNGSGSNPPSARLRGQNFSLVISTISVRENGCVLLYSWCFSKGKFRNDKENYLKEEKKSALFTIFWKEKLKKKLEIVCELENGKISGDREIIGDMRKIENNKRRCVVAFL